MAPPPQTLPGIWQTLFEPGRQIMPLTLPPDPRFKKLSTPLMNMIISLA